MNLSRCNQGHYYDSSKYPVCPFCSGQGPSAGVTRHMGNVTSGNATPGMDIPKTQHLSVAQQSGAADIPVTRAINSNRAETGENTIGILKVKTGIDPVVGWLVCIEGASRGQDYRILSGQNFIGRGEGMHIKIKGDDSISREKHAAVIYDSKHNRFFVQGGEGRDLVYLNGAPVLSVMELKAYDKIEVGSSNLLFIPLCGEGFKWE